MKTRGHGLVGRPFSSVPDGGSGGHAGCPRGVAERLQLAEALGLGWPKGITPEAHVNYDLWIDSVIAAFVVGVIVWGLMFWTSAFHRKKATDRPNCPVSSATTCRWSWC